MEWDTGRWESCSGAWMTWKERETEQLGLTAWMGQWG